MAPVAGGAAKVCMASSAVVRTWRYCILSGCSLDLTMKQSISKFCFEEQKRGRRCDEVCSFYRTSYATPDAFLEQVTRLEAPPL